MDGDWNLKGCGSNDPSRLTSVDDVVSLIHKTGFLSFFAVAVPGCSVEEHTYSWDWWTDDPDTDPWNWRMKIAARDDIAYGKFFDRKAGFISKEWFPTFANYRRDGYDYEGFYQDGKMKNQAKKILDVLELNEDAIGLEQMSGQLRKKAGVEKGFDNVLIDLQMQSFLLISRFQQKRNKRGEEYGWHLPCFMTPETKWGYDFVNSEDCTADESWEKIAAKVREGYPDAGEKDIRKAFGIRR